MRDNDFTTGKILPKLLKFMLPVLAALFLQAMYSAVDLLIVGKFSETGDISAVATGGQIMHAITNALVALSTGVTVLIGQKIGEGKAKEAGKAIGSGICLFFLIAAVLTALLVCLTSPVCRLMQAPEGAFDQTVAYVRICSAGTVFIVAFNVLGSVFRGIGDSQMPLITVAIACVVNIFGDLLLVSVFGMGAAGAALATVFAQAVSVLLSLVIIRRRKLPFEFSRSDIRMEKESVSGILQIGTPIALQELLVSISFLVIMAIVNSLGLIQSAGVGVAQKICAFVMLVPSAFSQAMSAFVAQNIGARKPERANGALRCGIASSLLAGLVIGYVAFFHGNLLAGIFANEEAVIQGAASYLKAYAIDCLLTAFLFCFTGYFSGCGKTVFVMVQGIVGAFGVRIPVSFLMSRIPGVKLFMIGLATPCSTILQIILCGIYFAKIKKQQQIETDLPGKEPIS